MKSKLIANLYRNNLLICQQELGNLVVDFDKISLRSFRKLKKNLTIATNYRGDIIIYTVDEKRVYEVPLYDKCILKKGVK